jgi:hypothetical protein
VNLVNPDAARTKIALSGTKQLFGWRVMHINLIRIAKINFDRSHGIAFARLLAEMIAFWIGFFPVNLFRVDFRSTIAIENLDIEGLENPTLELISKWLWDRLHNRIPGLAEIALSRDTCHEGCIYTGPSRNAQ